MTESEWKKAKIEYATQGMTQRQIAKKYGVDPGQVGRRAKKEGWLEARQRHDSEVSAEIMKASKASKVDREKKLLDAGDRLLEQVVNYLMESAISPKEFRQISATLLDLKELHGIKSDADRREQDARILALQSKVRAEEDDEETGVIMLPAVKEDAHG